MVTMICDGDDEDDVGGDDDYDDDDDAEDVDGWQEALLWMNGLECWTMSTFCQPHFKYQIPGSRYEISVPDMTHQDTSNLI